jgi:hypothetical protein
MAKPKNTTAMIGSTQFNTPSFQGILHPATASNELRAAPVLALENRTSLGSFSHAILPVRRVSMWTGDDGPKLYARLSYII